MERIPQQVQRARIGPFEVNFALGELRKHGIRLKVHDQPLQVLAMLVARPGELVTREEIRQSLWPSGTFVDFDNGLNSAINRLRDALGDSAEAPKFIETIPRRGYRFIAPVEVVRVPQEQAHRSRRLIWVAGASLAAVFTLAVFGSWYALRGRKPTVGFHARDWVLIANFENRTGDPILDGTLEFALERELSNSQFVNVVPRERIDDVLRLMRKPLNTKIDAALGREICLRDGAIRALLTGRMEKLGSTYVLSVELVDPIPGVTLASLSEGDPAESQLAAVVRRLSNRVRETLGEELRLIQQSEQKLAKVTSPSLPALQLYTKADDLIYQGNSAAAEQLLKQAVAEDPKFASAYIHLAWAIHNQGRAAKDWRPAAQRAVELAEMSSDRERYFILGSYYHLLGQPEKAVAAYEALLRLYPDHYWAIGNLGGLLRPLGRLQEVIPHVVALAGMRPNDLGANVRAVQALAIWSKNPAQAQPYLQRGKALLAAGVRRADPEDIAWLELFPAYEHWVRGDIARTYRELTRVAQSVKAGEPAMQQAQGGSGGIDLNLGYFYLTLGRLKEAQESFQRVSFISNRKAALALVVFARGDREKLREDLQRVDTRLIGGTTMAVLLVRAGLFHAAEEMIRRLEEGARGQTWHMKIARGELALARGQRGEGIALLQDAVRITRESEFLSVFLLARESLAGAYERQGQLEQAIAILEEVAPEKARLYVWHGLTGYFWLRTQLQLAGLYRKVGREADARKIEEELHKLLALADPDHPMLVQLKQGDRRALASFPH